LTEENDILLIFDEVATAFRVSLGGAQEILGVTPDITVFGKPVGGGIPIGAVGGSEDIMGVVGVLDPKADCFGPNYIFPMGSFCEHPLAMAAGITTIEELEKGDYIKNAILRSEELVKGINEVAKALKVDFSAYNVYPVVHFGLSIKPDMSNAIDWLEFNQMVRLILLVSDPGVVVLPGHVYMSGVHTKEDIDKAVLAFENCLGIYKM
jgi:glutamate-1-semialdehyde 2,1-aminomutase